MKRYFDLLWALLAVQLVLAAWIFWQGEQPAHGPGAQPLAKVAVAEVDRLVIGDADSTVTLSRVGDQWQLAPLFALPARQEKVREVLDKIGETMIEWPVTTTTGSQERLEVSASKFQRHVQLYRGQEAVADFYLGTSPGFRQVHLRRDGDEAVYAVELAVNDLPASADSWLDNALLAVGELKRIAGADYTLVSSGEDSWVFDGEPVEPEQPAASLDAQAAERLASAFSTLRVQSVAQDLPAAVTEEEGVTVGVETADVRYVYRFSALDGKYYVQRDDMEQAFTISQYEYQRIAGLGRADLMAESSEMSDEGEAVAEDVGNGQSPAAGEESPG